MLRRPSRQLKGAVLAICGLGADCIAGVWLLVAADTRILCLYVPAVLTWVAGIRLLTLQQVDVETDTYRSAWHQAEGAPQPSSPSWQQLGTLIRLHRPGAPESSGGPSRRADALGLDGWTAVALMLGLLPFPAVAPLGMSIALGTIWLLRLVPRSRAATHAPAIRSLDTAHAPRLSAIRELEVQPIVDILRGSNRALKRAAIRAIAQQPSRERVQLLRDLLVDPDADLRDAASLALFRLEAGFERALNQAEHREGGPQPTELADLYMRYASSGLLDDISSTLYLRKACDVLRQAIAEDSPHADQKFQLAYLLSDLGLDMDARAALDYALDDRPANVRSYLQGMEVAFRGGRWEQLQALARLAVPVATSDPQSAMLARWWAGVSGEPAWSEA